MSKVLFSLFLLVRRPVYLVLHAVDLIFSRQSKLFILSYHSIAEDQDRFSIDPEVMKKQLTYLKKHFQFVTLSDVEAVVSGKKIITKPSVVLTVDDGYKDILEMKSFFEKNKIRPALFVLSNAKSPNRKELGNNKAFLSQKELKSLKKAGWEIGCHSATHANLATVSGKKLHDEIITSKKTLEKELGKSITYFAYPRGKYSEQVVKTVQKANFTLGLTMDDGLITPKVNPLLIPRIGIDRTHSFAEFRAAFSPSVIAGRNLVKQTFIGRYL